MKMTGWMRRSRGTVESIFIPVSVLLLSFHRSTCYSLACRCQEVEADDLSCTQRETGRQTERHIKANA